MRSWPLLFLLLSIACGGTTSTPTAPSPLSSSSAAPEPAAASGFTGTVTDTVSGAPVVGFTAVVTGGRVTITAPGYVTRETANRATVDLIRDAPPFDAAFYRALVRNGYEAPGDLQALRRQASGPLRIYLKTVDEKGTPVDSTTLNTVRTSITPALVQALTGGAVTLAGIESGTELRSGPGWITIRWISAFADNRCGQAAIGGDWIELRSSGGGCSCRNSGVTYPRAVKHEIGHALGYWHTDGRNDLMFDDGAGGNDCDNNPSAREQYHAAIAYKRPSGNRDPDVDPRGTTSLTRVVID